MKRITIVVLFFIAYKYYVLDVEYPNTREYRTPYKGTNIHYYYTPDFLRGQTTIVEYHRTNFSSLESQVAIIERYAC